MTDIKYFLVTFFTIVSIDCFEVDKRMSLVILQCTALCVDVYCNPYKVYPVLWMDESCIFLHKVSYALFERDNFMILRFQTLEMIFSASFEHCLMTQIAVK